MSLRLTLIVFIVLPVSIILSIASTMTLHSLTTLEESRLQKDVELIARAIQTPLTKSLKESDLDQIQETLDSILEFRRIHSASVYNHEGRLIISQGEDDPASEVLEIFDFDEIGEHKGDYDQLQRHRVYSHFVLLTGPGGTNLGMLQLTRRRSEIESALSSLQNRAASFIFGVSLLIALIILFAHRVFVGRPLNELIRVMNRIVGGEIFYRSSVSQPKEVAAVSAGLNDMVDHLVLAKQDIDRRRIKEEELQRDLQNKERLASIGRLAAGVAHELGAPMSVVDGLAQRALRGSSQRDDRSEVFSDIRAEISRMEKIVRQLLEFSQQMPAGTLEEVDLVSVLEDSKRLVERSLQVNDKIEIVSHSDSPMVEMDPARAEQLFVNLIKNAVQAGPGGGVRICVEDEGAQIKVSVEDSGPGVPEPLKERIFDPFFTTKAVGSGTGLGLSVVHGILEDFNGQIAVKDSPDGGALFELRLPRKKEAQHAHKG